MADEYIKRETAIVRATRIFGLQDSDAYDVKEVIKAIPVANVAPVVRCKDCKHNWTTTANKGKPDRPRCKYTDYILDLDDFCSRGERKDNE